MFLNITWKKKMESPCEMGGQHVAEGRVGKKII